MTCGLDEEKSVQLHAMLMGRDVHHGRTFMTRGDLVQIAHLPLPAGVDARANQWVNSALAAAKKSGNAEAVQRAAEGQKKALKATDAANASARTKLKAWNEERDKGEPNHVQHYRASLLRCQCVKQLFDPWFMDANTRDASEPTPNMQKSGNETLHAHHLHITVDDPKIL